MDTVNFYPKTFAEIDAQDNPSTGDIECLLIVKSELMGGSFAEVFHIKPTTIEPADSVGVFWKEVKAVEYCELLVDDAPELFHGTLKALDNLSI